MALVEKLLARDERILLESRRHPLFMVLHSGPYLLGALLFLALGILAIVFIPDVSGVDVGLIIGLIAIAGSLIPLAIGAYRIIFWWREMYYVTSYRILQVEGTMNRRMYDSALEKVNDIVMSQSVFGRMFNYGTIKIVTGSDAAINNIAGVSDPYTFKRVLMEAKMEFGNRGMDDDGFRAQPVAPQQSPSMQAAETNRLPSINNSEDQSRAVIALTELRNSGVITDAEFNEKLRRLTESS